MIYDEGFVVASSISCLLYSGSIFNPPMTETDIHDDFADAPFDEYYRSLMRQPGKTALMPNEVRDVIPGLYAQQHNGVAATVYLRLCGADDTIWYITEFDGHDTLFGFVHVLVGKWTDISLSALQKWGRLW